jgi:hypothetical protein
MDPSTWPESKIDAKERVKSFSPSSYEITNDLQLDNSG